MIDARSSQICLQGISCQYSHDSSYAERLSCPCCCSSSCHLWISRLTTMIWACQIAMPLMTKSLMMLHMPSWYERPPQHALSDDHATNISPLFCCSTGLTQAVDPAKVFPHCQCHVLPSSSLQLLCLSSRHVPVLHRMLSLPTTAAHFKQLSSCCALNCS